jgi:N-acetylglucosaminyldiphosphoundecaprenol N-acetyl-beta-D-mannosaminyltransferase
MTSAVGVIGQWVTARENRYVCAADVHSVMRAQDDPSHMEALRRADMILPDGMPLVLVSRALGEKSIERVCGPDLMLRILESSVTEGWRHYFYGGAEGVADTLARKAAARCPGLLVAGMDCPPFRPLSVEENVAAIARINDAAPDIVWVGLGCPKQENWMLGNIDKLNGVVAIGVGAAFDFHSGRIARAPPWMRSKGLEWLHRLVSEPRRLWRRYLSLAPRFVVLSLADAWRSRRPFKR